MSEGPPSLSPSLRQGPPFLFLLLALRAHSPLSLTRTYDNSVNFGMINVIVEVNVHCCDIN